MDSQPLQVHSVPLAGIHHSSTSLGSVTTASPTATQLKAQQKQFRKHESRILDAVRLLYEADLNSNHHNLKSSKFLRPEIKQNLLATSKSSSFSDPKSKFSNTSSIALTITDASTLSTNTSGTDTMSTRDAYLAYLRPAIIHILRASGFHAAKPAAVDSLVDITARYLEVLAIRTAESAHLTSNCTIPSITDARNALEYAGALKPEMGAAEEQLYGDDDLRGVHSLISWFDSPQAKQIRRVAGLEGDATSTVALPGEETVAQEDYLAKLKKKHSQTGDQERFRGTMLGGDLPAQKRIIEGGGPTSIAAWRAKMFGEEIVEEDQEDTESG